MRNIQCYPKVNVAVKLFEGRYAKRMTVPSQSLSLREILRRFVRREALPTSQDGVYEDRFGDLEKMTRLDIVEQMEQVEKWKSQIKAFEERNKAQAEKDAADKVLADKAAIETEVQNRLAQQAREGKPA